MRFLLASLASISLHLISPAQEPTTGFPREMVPLPEGSVPYKGNGYTQSISITNNRDAILAVSIARLETKWQHSGGLHNVSGWVSDKFKYLPAPPKTWIGNIYVKNSFGHYQPNRGILRDYAVGTRFDDVLSSYGIVFEHRSREKTKDGWSSKVLYKDEKARPEGYVGLTKSCISCHGEAGSGEYGVGLVPGGDTIFSDPLDWSLVR